MSNSSAKFQTSRNFSFKNLLRIIPEIIQRDKLFVRCAGDPVAVFLAQVIEILMNNKPLELQLGPPQFIPALPFLRLRRSHQLFGLPLSEDIIVNLFQPE